MPDEANSTRRDPPAAPAEARRRHEEDSVAERLVRKLTVQQTQVHTGGTSIPKWIVGREEEPEKLEDRKQHSERSRRRYLSSQCRQPLPASTRSRACSRPTRSRTRPFARLPPSSCAHARRRLFSTIRCSRARRAPSAPAGHRRLHDVRRRPFRQRPARGIARRLQGVRAAHPLRARLVPRPARRVCSLAAPCAGFRARRGGFPPRRRRRRRRRRCPSTLLAVDGRLA